MPVSASSAARLQYQHQTMHELLHHYSGEQLTQRINPEKWSAFENMVHAISYQPTFLHRMQRIQNEDSPFFERYTADGDPLFHEYLRLPLPALTTKLHEHRAAINNYISTLDNNTLARTGRHSKYGSLTIPEWTEFFLLHEAHHIFTAFMLLTELKNRSQQ